MKAGEVGYICASIKNVSETKVISISIPGNLDGSSPLIPFSANCGVVFLGLANAAFPLPPRPPFATTTSFFFTVIVYQKILK